MKPTPPHDGDGLIHALRAAFASRPDQPEGLTTAEIADVMRDDDGEPVPLARVNRLLIDLHRRKLLISRRALREARDMTWRPVPVYSLKK